LGDAHILTNSWLSRMHFTGSLRSRFGLLGSFKSIYSISSLTRNLSNSWSKCYES